MAAIFEREVINDMSPFPFLSSPFLIFQSSRSMEVCTILCGTPSFPDLFFNFSYEYLKSCSLHFTEQSATGQSRVLSIKEQQQTSSGLREGRRTVNGLELTVVLCLGCPKCLS